MGQSRQDKIQKMSSTPRKWPYLEPLAESTRGELDKPLGFWSREYRGSEAHCIPAVKEMLAAYKEVPAAFGVIGTKAQFPLAS